MFGDADAVSAGPEVTPTSAPAPGLVTADEAPQRPLLWTIARLCMAATIAVTAIEMVAFSASADPWKLATAACMATLTGFFAAALVLLHRGRERAALWTFLATVPLAIPWVMITGGPSTVLPTVVAAVTVMLVFPQILRPGASPPRSWIAILVTSYLAGIALRLAFRGLDLAGSYAELAVLVLVPSVLILVQWLLTQRVIAAMRGSLRESEALRRALEDRHRELRQTAAALTRASTAKSQFLANMSHELRTPLNIIIGYTELLQESLPGAEEAAPRASATWRADLDKVRAASGHLLGLISDVLDLSKIEAGKATVTLESVDVDALLHEVADAVAPLVEAGGNRLVLELDEALAAIETDRLKLRQILLNLLSNAAKFTSAGTITIRAVLAEQGLTLEVVDSGIGIAAAAQQRIFEAFEQVDGSSTRSHGGTGLGLTLTRRLTRLLGGEITLESALGQGATFRVTLPRSPLTRERP